MPRFGGASLRVVELQLQSRCAGASARSFAPLTLEFVGNAIGLRQRRRAVFLSRPPGPGIWAAYFALPRQTRPYTLERHRAQRKLDPRLIMFLLFQPARVTAARDRRMQMDCKEAI
jgi:hypothetical protein